MSADVGVAEFLEWDSAFWGKRIGRARVANLKRTDDLDQWAAQNDVDCVFFLAGGDDPASAHAAEAGGFRLMDVRVELARDAAPAPLAAGIREVRPGESDRLRAIASSSHGVTRFYADPNFPDDRCDEFYGTWIRNSLDGWAAGVLVAENDGDGGPVGYVSCHIDDGTGSIGLIAVDANARGGGVGVALSESAVAWCAERGVDRMTVATQARNIPALRTFERSGFLVTNVGIWFHKWYT